VISNRLRWILVSAALCCLPAAARAAEDAVNRIDQRFAAESISETPDFRQHVVPLMGKLGCNGRACHGSFQGRGGLRLSLFGYDFKADHEALAKGDKPRVNTAAVAESLMLQKPLQVIPHEGGTRLKEGTWQHRVLVKWIEAGAKPIDSNTPEFVRLEVTPAEIVTSRRGETFDIKAIAVWSNGAREDVTPLCRFQTNNDQIATIDDAGRVTSAGPGDSHVVVFYDNGVVPIPVMQPVSDKFGPNYPQVTTPTKIDELVVQKLRKLGMLQSDLCSDAEFLRRVSLDMVGTLPSSAEVEAFLQDSSADKRARKIDELLERPAYAAWWATRFSDWTGNNAGKLNNNVPDQYTMATQWYEWLRTRIEKNVPYDELAEGIILAVSRDEGESYKQYCERMSSYHDKQSGVTFSDQPSLTHYWIRREFRTPEERALGFAYTFLGLRIQCAQCHKHPFDQWTKDDFDRFKEFFGRVTYRNAPGTKDDEEAILKELGVTKGAKNNDLRKELTSHLAKGHTVPFQELYVAAPPRKEVPRDKVKENKKRPPIIAGRTAKVLGGEEIKIDQMDDPREALMDWLRDDDNPYFARSIVNRIWANYFNVGIVEPVDDLSLANPPSNEPLLDYLTVEFRNHKYDMKWLHRTIANSRTYQLSWRANGTNEFDERNFARAVPRRLPAEVAYDSLQLATMSDMEAAKWRSSVDGRAIGNSIVDTRANGRGKSSYALSIFGRSIRDSNCECDRSTEASLLQTVFLQNDSETLGMIGGKGRWVDQIMKQGEPDRAKPAAPDLKERQERRIADVTAARLKERLAAAEKKGKAELVAAIKKELVQREAPPADATVPENPSPEAPVVDVKAIIRLAYLRTLSRYPTEAEIDRASRHFEETGDAAHGAKDLLWALVNTKEFVVNH
jgi:hypothetical protein